MRVRFNQQETVTLLLDTGASGISLSPKAAERAGLAILGSEANEAKGFGDDRAQEEYNYVASEVRIGEIQFADYPVSVFRSAKSPDYDGLIGADVFRRFLVTIDFPRLELMAEPLSGGGKLEEDEPADAGPPAEGFYRIFRFGNHLAVPAVINKGAVHLFLLDSGSTANLVDTAIARESSGVYRDERTRVKGIQGEVKQVSRADNVTLTFAGFRQENPTLIAISLEKLGDGMGVGFGGVLGMPVLGQLRVSLNYADGTARFEYRR